MPSEGPRHAAPRKPLLARLHMPAGKAVALAAMPSAVLMGMGLTPTLAAAKPAPKKLFDGACATAPDTAAEGGTPESGKPSGPSGGPSEKPSEKPSGKPGEKPSSGPSAAPSAGPSAGKQKAPDKEPDKAPAAGKSASAKPAAPSRAPSPAPSPSASKATNPLDPLGLGDKLHDILTGGAKPPAASSPSPAAPAPSAPSSSAAPAPKRSAQSEKPGEKPAEKDKDKTEDKDAPSTGPSTSPSPAPSGSTSPSPEGGTGTADGELPPCPQGTVVDENEHHAFPNQPWYLEASKLTLTGLTYEGVKKITMVNGQKKDVLKFTADALTIKDLHQIVNSQGKQYHVAGIGTDSTITGGKVTMYTEELKGNLLGLIPATHSPSVPPPLIPGLKLPIPVFYTNVKIRQGGQFGGTLHIPNLHQYITEGTYP
ncbi:hypothetical protein GO001_11675 [Streptomyces sp. NRRL B-1677]|uniref:hypothetical protein n=1 Tax=Streptomyces sp. NRRL B-1677 TaxID=2682966 RepID=UPI001892B2B9|nr:hypothetical protein [Streptomyces sp. NRRL B-1677]MBF6045878.1 hypothetical protein [Streptomyces sp. NRRL B-1677]